MKILLASPPVQCSCFNVWLWLPFYGNLLTLTAELMEPHLLKPTSVQSFLLVAPKFCKQTNHQFVSSCSFISSVSLFVEVNISLLQFPISLAGREQRNVIMGSGPTPPMDPRILQSAKKLRSEVGSLVYTQVGTRWCTL